MRPIASALVAAVALFACGGKKGAARPGASRVDSTTPFILDWKPETRAELEATMKSGLAILEHHDGSIRFLPRCTAAGTYAFVGARRADHSFQLKTADQIRETLPTSGAGIAAKLDSELKSGTTIDVAMVSIGDKKADRSALRRSELRGECEGATHFVRRANVGAYVVRLGRKGRVASAERMSRPDGTLASAFLQAGGSIGACTHVPSFIAEPPPDCEAVLRVELQRIE